MDYVKYPEAKNCIITGVDEYEVSNLLQSYFSKIRKFVNTTWELTNNLPESDKKGILQHIYDYAMIIIHPYIFPRKPTELDTKLKSRIEKFKLLTTQQLEIKPENCHLQLWEFCINR